MLNTLRRDIRAVFERDPAARSLPEVLFCYPGLHALWIHRLAHACWNHHLKFLGRFLSHLGRFLTGIEIHPGARLGPGLFIDHGMGVVIGETTVIGRNVTIYQGVTLGGTGKDTGKRHPTIEDWVVIGVGATVLGNITIGRGTRVGGGAVVVNDVPPDCTVVGVPGRVVVREGARVEAIDLHHEDLPDPVIEMFRCIQHRIDRIDARLTRDEAVIAEGPARPDGPSSEDAVPSGPTPAAVAGGSDDGSREPEGTTRGQDPR
jgi:serine O-acetyltransferase